MANTIKLKRGTSTPSTSDISNGEVAIDTSAKKLYINDSGTVKEIGGGGAGTGEFFVKAKDGSGNLSSSGINTFAGYLAGNALANGAQENTFYGTSAGKSVTTGDDNTYIGFECARETTDGNTNTALGSGAYFASTGGNANTVLGAAAMGGGTPTGDSNVAVGKNSLYVVSSGSNNTAVGTDSLKALTTGTYNVAIGRGTAQTLTTGSYNVLLGKDAGGGDTVTGGYNVGIGNHACYLLTSGEANTSIGADSLLNITTGNNNVALGMDALRDVSSGNSNVGLGKDAARNLTTSTGNVAIGFEALYTEDTKSGVVAIGYRALKSQNATYGLNTAVGYMAGAALTDSTENVFVGYSAGAALTTGGGTFIGGKAGEQTTTGSSLVAVGKDALKANTTGSSNVAVGDNSLAATTTGQYNTALGTNAGDSITTGGQNVCIGTNAGSTFTTVSHCVYIGKDSGQNATGNGNTGVGLDSLRGATGASNTSLGRGAGEDLTSGSNNLILGAFAEASAADVSNEITLGDSNITKFRIPGLNFSLKDTTATEDYVLTVDANGDCGWEAVSASDNTKLPLAGGTMTGHLLFGDGIAAKFGASTDLQIEHTGSNSTITDSGTGKLVLKSDNQIELVAANNESMIEAIVDGATKFYYDGSKKFETTADGIACSSQGTDNSRLYFLTSGHTNTRIGYVGLTRFGMDVNGGLEIRDVGNSYDTMFKTISNGATELYYDGSKKFHTFTGGVKFFGALEADDDDIIKLGDNADFQIYHDGSTNIINGVNGNTSIRTAAAGTSGENAVLIVPNGAVSLYYDDTKKFETDADGVTITGQCAVTSHVAFPDHSSGYVGKAVFGNGDDLQIFHSGTKSYIKDAGTGSLRINSDDFRVYNAADDEYMLRAVQDGGVNLYYDNVQKINTNASGVDIGLSSNACHLMLFDGGQARFGNGQDLLIYHDGSSSYIKDQGTGNLKIDGSDNVELQAGGSTKAYTYANGLFVYNQQIPDNGELNIGNGSDLKLWHDGSNSYIKNSTNALTALTGGFYINNVANSESMAAFNANSHCSLYYDNSQKFYTQSDKIVSAGHCYPETDDTYTLGHTSYRWYQVHSRNTAKAYGNFNQTNHGARLNFNIASYTDYGTGQTRVTFSTALSNNSYIVCTGGSRDQPESSRCHPSNIDGMATTHFDITNHNDGSTNVDWTLMMFTVFGT